MANFIPINSTLKISNNVFIYLNYYTLIILNYQKNVKNKLYFIIYTLPNGASQAVCKQMLANPQNKKIIIKKINYSLLCILIIPKLQTA